MSDKDIKRLIDLADQKLQQPLTKDEALQSLMDAGILDQNGNPTGPYRELSGKE